jgi:hypothetical protein
MPGAFDRCWLCDATAVFNVIAAQAGNPESGKQRMDCFVASLPAMTVMCLF